MALKTTEERVTDYLAQITRGKLKIQPHHASNIMSIVLGSVGLAGMAQAKKYCYNAMNGSYRPYRTIATSDALIKQRILEALENGPIEGFYKYELYNAKGEFEGNIFSVSPNLFD